MISLDKIDWMIINELQNDASITNIELSRRVGISAPPCLRRVRALEEKGIIRGYRTLVNEKLLGYELIAFAMIGLERQNDSELEAFIKHIQKSTFVRECYMLSGDIDFMLKCVAPNLNAFQEFIINDLTRMPAVSSVKTALSIREVKNTPTVPDRKIEG